MFKITKKTYSSLERCIKKARVVSSGENKDISSYNVVLFPKNLKFH